MFERMILDSAVVWKWLKETFPACVRLQFLYSISSLGFPIVQLLFNGLEKRKQKKQNLPL